MKIEPLFLQLVKNLRGIIYFSPNLKPKEEIKWLKRKLRYRNLGISENLKVEKWKKLVVLKRIERNAVLDSLFQASLFVCPLLILKEESLKDYEKAIVASLRTKQKLSDRELKFNLRLVNYSITDFYLKAIELGRRGDIKKRKKLAEAELKRFWRIEADEKGKTLIAFIDPLLLKKEIKNELFMSLVPALILDFE